MSLSTSLGSTETTTEVTCSGSLVSPSLLRYLAEWIVLFYAFSMDRLKKGYSWSSSSGRTSQVIE